MALTLPITTSRLVLRRFVDGDRDAFVGYRRHPDVARYQSWDEDFSDEAADAFMAEMTTAAVWRPGEWFQIAIEHDGVMVGDVAFWFLAEVAEEPAAPPTMETAAAGSGIVRYLFGPQGGNELCLVGNAETTTGGVLLARPPGTTAWKNHDLAPLEFQLLRALCVRAHAEADSPAAARGCVATKQLARDLPWQSKYANEENVRQVVRRLRGALSEAGADGILAVVPGRGYYLSCPVAVSR